VQMLTQIGRLGGDLEEIAHRRYRRAYPSSSRLRPPSRLSAEKTSVCDGFSVLASSAGA